MNWDLIKEATLNPEHSKDKVIEILRKLPHNQTMPGNAIVQGVIIPSLVGVTNFVW